MRPKVQIIVLLAICILIRLPQLLNPEIALDGDEAVHGIMIKHIVAGKEFPIYFKGQSYGLTLFESLFSLPLCYIFGVTTFTIKFSHLLFWVIGAIFFYKVLTNLNTTDNQYIPFMLSMILITMPAWGIWSMKARGGYITAFTCTAIVLYLITNDHKKKHLSYLMIGLLCGIIYEAQKLWIVGLVPIILTITFISRSFTKKLSILSVGAIVSIGFLSLFKPYLPYGHKPVLVEKPVEFISNIKNIPIDIYTVFHGKYYLGLLHPVNVFTALSSYIAITTLIILLLAGVILITKNRRENLLFFSAIISIIITISYTPAARYLEPRFLLPLPGLVLLAVQLLINELKKVKYVLGVGTATVAIGLIATITLWNFQAGRVSLTAISKTIDYLQKHNTKYVFTTYTILDFQLIFYSDEAIIGRSAWPPGKFPEYFKEVNEAFYAKQNIAVIGHPHEYFNMALEVSYPTDELFVAINPPPEQLQIGFIIE